MRREQPRNRDALDARSSAATQNSSAAPAEVRDDGRHAGQHDDCHAKAFMYAGTPPGARGRSANSSIRLDPSTASWEKVASITSPQKERRRDGQQRQHERHAEQLRHPEEAQLRDPRLEDGDGRGQREQLEQEGPRRPGRAPPAVSVARDAPRHEEVAEQGEEDQQLQRRRPLEAPGTGPSTRAPSPRGSS